MSERRTSPVPLGEHPVPRWRPTRLGGFDYRERGPYLVTVVVRGRRWLFGTLVGEGVLLTALGETARRAIDALPSRRPGLEVVEGIVMPDHLHVILLLPSPSEEPRSKCMEAGSLSAVVGGLKAEVSRAAPDRLHPLWQRGFHDRIIRHDRELADAIEYVRMNPERWAAKHSASEQGRDR